MTGEVLRSAQETRVLVVEDEPRLRDVLVSALPEMGFQATGAASAEDAIKIMESGPHDTVVLDLNLPGMDGLDMLELLHERWPNTQVIILTGFGDLEAARRAIRLDVVDFLTKPASLGELEIALDRARCRRMQSINPAPVQLARHRDEPEDAREGPPRMLGDLERVHILAALDRNDGNRAATAAELGISLRTLYYRLAEYQRQGFAT